MLPSKSGTTNLRLSLLMSTTHPLVLHNNPSHGAALQAAENFIQSIDIPEATITSVVDKRRAENIAENKHFLKCVTESMLYYARHCIVLRGDHEKLDSLGNSGNFLSLMNLIATHDTKLRQHLDMPKLNNATYLSPETQNEMIQVIGKRMIRSKIVQQVKDAQLYTIMADEVTSANTKLMPVFIRFVDKDLTVREELLEVISLKRITVCILQTRLKTD